jgi:predicted protein tyrosine phosphatase
MMDRPERIGRRVAPFYDYVPPHDWTWLTEQLATGAMPLTRKEMNRLVRSGITHVVTVCTEAPLNVAQVLCTDSRITHLLNAEPDDGRWKEPVWFQRTLAFALPAIAAGGKVYVHCLLGSNRGPAHAYAILRASGYDRVDAEWIIRSARPRARILYLPDAEAAVRELTTTARKRGATP